MGDDGGKNQSDMGGIVILFWSRLTGNVISTKNRVRERFATRVSILVNVTNCRQRLVECGWMYFHM
jgi:hypothetical protein